ncbi:hypothetical protein NHG35_00415 [Aerococcaceae bacterium NML180378]|nr:hypothetical protein [Aerococcaceae bacterium NML180378]MDO4774498.1 hypothetical protein [Aerococcaceae bacterium]
MFIGNLHRSNVLVMFSLFFGAVGIGFAIINQTQYALLSLIVATVADVFIYKFSRAFDCDEAVVSFAKGLEYLADFVIFGVLPAVLLIQVLQANVWGVLLAALYMSAVAIRLAHFNRAARFQVEHAPGTTLGVKVEMVGLILPIVALLGYVLPLVVFQVVFAIVYVLLAVGYVWKREVPEIPAAWTLYIFALQALVAVALIALGSIFK